jgi:hypothetical protein
MAYSCVRAKQEKKAEVPTPALVFSPLPDPVKGRPVIVRSPLLSNCGDGHHHTDPLLNP